MKVVLLFFLIKNTLEPEVKIRNSINDTELRLRSCCYFYIKNFILQSDTMESEVNNSKLIAVNAMFAKLGRQLLVD